MFDLATIQTVINALFALDLSPVVGLIAVMGLIIFALLVTVVRQQLRIIRLRAEIRRLKGNPIKRAFVRFLRGLLGKLDGDTEPQPQRRARTQTRGRSRSSKGTSIPGFEDFFGGEG